jgi:hypothetical protein
MLVRKGGNAREKKDERRTDAIAHNGLRRSGRSFRAASMPAIGSGLAAFAGSSRGACICKKISVFAVRSACLDRGLDTGLPVVTPRVMRIVGATGEHHIVDTVRTAFGKRHAVVQLQVRAGLTALPGLRVDEAALPRITRVHRAAHLSRNGAAARRDVGLGLVRLPAAERGVGQSDRGHAAELICRRAALYRPAAPVGRNPSSLRQS